MIKLLYRGKNVENPVNQYMCDTYEDIEQIPNKKFGDTFIVATKPEATFYIVNGNDEIVEYSWSPEIF